MRRSLLPVTLSNRKNISSNRAMSMSQTSFLIRSDGLKSKLSGGCAICLLVSDGPACCCCCSSPCRWLSCSMSPNFISLSLLSRLVESHLILVCKVALLSSSVITSLSLHSIWEAISQDFVSYFYFSLTFFLLPPPHANPLPHDDYIPVYRSCYPFFFIVGKYIIVKAFS